MNLSQIKILVEGRVIEGTIEEDSHFLGGKKVIYETKSGVTAILSINLVNIVSDEISGSTRN